MHMYLLLYGEDGHEIHRGERQETTRPQIDLRECYLNKVINIGYPASKNSPLAALKMK